MLNFLSFYHAGTDQRFYLEPILERSSFAGQEIYKEFDYFIRFLHQRVLKVGGRDEDLSRRATTMLLSI